MSTQRHNLTDPELLEYSRKHVHYEIAMFFGLANILSQIPQPDLGTPVTTRISHHALLESFIVHLRNVLLFLYPYDSQTGDIISDDFFVDPIQEWKRKRPKEEVALRVARDRASKEVSHLTIHRRDDADPAKPWQFLELAKLVKAVFDEFVENASSKKLDSKVTALVKSIDLTTPVKFTDPSSGSI